MSPFAPRKLRRFRLSLRESSATFARAKGDKSRATFARAKGDKSSATFARAKGDKKLRHFRSRKRRQKQRHFRGAKGDNRCENGVRGEFFDTASRVN